MAICTKLTFLQISKEGNFEKLIDIIDYPDLGGEPNLLDSTTLSDESEKNSMGITKGAELKFSAFYTLEDYKKLEKLVNQKNTYRIFFGKTGEDGIFEFTGLLSIYVTGGGVDELRKIQLTFTNENGISRVDS